MSTVTGDSSYLQCQSLFKQEIDQLSVGPFPALGTKHFGVPDDWQQQATDS
jgi:hypothetical protein